MGSLAGLEIVSPKERLVSCGVVLSSGAGFGNQELLGALLAAFWPWAVFPFKVPASQFDASSAFLPFYQFSAFFVLADRRASWPFCIIDTFRGFHVPCPSQGLGLSTIVRFA